MPQTHYHIKNQCANCSLKELCLPIGLQGDDFEQLDAVIKQSRRLKKGEFLFHAGEPFHALYAIRTGFFKATVGLQDGRDQVTGFFMSGELMGMDGISNHVYVNNTIALEDSEVCELPFERLDELSKHLPILNMHFFKLMSREIIRDQNVMMMLGNMRAEERLAVFLLNLSDRLRMRGFAAYDFILRMSREEIGSYLGLKLETVSRILSRFNQECWVAVENKHIQILQPERLHELVSGCHQKGDCTSQNVHLHRRPHSSV